MVTSVRHELRSSSRFIGFTPYAYKTTGDTQTWRTPTETPHPKCEKDCRRREREGRSWEEHGRRLVPPYKNGNATSNACPVNLALAMARGSRKRVGILDLDIFGPSIPTLMGLNHGEEPELTDSKSLGTA
jgi:hypothetical protein